MENIENSVNTTCSAEERKQLDTIRMKYQPRGQEALTNLEMVKKLDAKAEGKAQILALSEGVVSALLFGLGMSCAWVWNQPVIGIAAGIVGFAGVCINWPLYQKALKAERDIVAPEILRLSTK